METDVSFKVETYEDILIFCLSWEFDETNVDKTFEEIYTHIWNFQDKKIILDFENILYINSKTVWYIADILSKTEESDWIICLSHCTKAVKDVLVIVWLTTIIPTLETLEEAIQHIKLISS